MLKVRLIKLCHEQNTAYVVIGTHKYFACVITLVRNFSTHIQEINEHCKRSIGWNKENICQKTLPKQKKDVTTNIKYFFIMRL